jgi:putative transcriptional regulator
MALEEGRGGLRASDADREQAVEVLKAAFVQDWLAKAEFEAHVGRALASRTYAELAAVTAGIAAPLSTVQPPDAPSPVREQRTRRKISQAELAKSLGVSRQTVILIENGRYLPSLPLAFTIARFFGLTVDDMFGKGTSAAPYLCSVTLSSPQHEPECQELSGAHVAPALVAPALVLRRVMRDTRPPGDLRQSKARIAAGACEFELWA